MKFNQNEVLLENSWQFFCSKFENFQNSFFLKIDDWFETWNIIVEIFPTKLKT